MNSFLQIIKHHPILFLVATTALFTIMFIIPQSLFIIIPAIFLYDYFHQPIQKVGDAYTPVPYDTDPVANPFMPAAEKLAYLRSPAWQSLRNQVLYRDRRQCQTCGCKTRLNVHHITYKNLGAEPLDNLVTLCDTCHTALHEELGYGRENNYPIKPKE